MKELLKTVCADAAALHEKGVISVGSCGNKKIHMTEEAFLKLFHDWKVKEHDASFDRWYVTEDGFEFFCLVPF